MFPPMTHWKSVNDHISKEFGGCTHVSQVVMDVDMDMIIPSLKLVWSRGPNRLRISEFFSLYSRLLADFLSHLGKWVKLIKFEAENECFCTWKVEKPQCTTSTP